MRKQKFIYTILALFVAMGWSVSTEAQIPGPFPFPPQPENAPKAEGQGPDVLRMPDELKSPNQTGAPNAGKESAAQGFALAVQPDEYILGPGDGLALNIWGIVQALYPLTVLSDGRVIIPAVGSIYVSGLSLTEAQSLLAEAVKRYYRDAKIAVSLTTLRSFEVQLVGQVKRPGTYLATAAVSILEAIGKAGGPTDYGSTRHVQLTRDGKTVSLDLMRFLRQGNKEVNPRVKDGDVIFVPPKESILVTLNTSAVRSGQSGLIAETPYRTTVELQEGEGLLDLLAMIGGFDPWWDAEKSFLERDDSAGGRITIPVNPYQLVVLKDISQNLVLRNGDVLTIPRAENRVYVMGEVKNSGPYLYLKDRRALDYVVQAGGGTQRADFGKAFVKRHDGTIIPLEKDPEITVGDVIVIPEVAIKWWQDYLTLSGFFLGLVMGPLLLVLTVL